MDCVDDYQKDMGDTLAMQREANAHYARMRSKFLEPPEIVRNYRTGEHMYIQKTLGIFEVFAVYAENPHMPLILRPVVAYIGASDEEEAVLRSGIHRIIDAARKEPTTEHLDPRYITIVCRKIAETHKIPQDA